ncbi:hypothetical protein WJX77_009832 [Trebouxia sp. C0004]
MPSLREVLGDKPSLGRHYNYLLRHKDKQNLLQAGTSCGRTEPVQLAELCNSFLFKKRMYICWIQSIRTFVLDAFIDNLLTLRRTSQVSHHVRRLTSCAQQDPQRLLGDSTELRMPPSGYAYGISASADSTPLLQSQQCDKGAHYYN